MNGLSGEDQYLLEQGLDPYYDGPTHPMSMEETDDELLKILAAREKYKKMNQQYPAGTDMYYEMQQPTSDREELEDALLMEMINEGY